MPLSVQLWPVGAQDAAAIGVVQQREFADELVLVRRDARAEGAEAGVAVAFLHVAENLVVRTVLLDDVNDVLEHARLADTFGNGLGGPVFARRQFRLRQQRITQVGQGGLRERRQLFRRRHGHK